MRTSYVQEVMGKLTMTTDSTRKGFVSSQDTLRLLGYCAAMVDLDHLSTDDMVACRRYLDNNRALTVAEAHRVGRMRIMYSWKKKGHCQ